MMGIKSIREIRLWVADGPHPLKNGVEQNPCIGGGAHTEVQRSQRVGSPPGEGSSSQSGYFLSIICISW